MWIRHLATPRHRQEVRSDEFTYSLPWEDPFVYRIAWDAGISRRTFNDPDAFNNPETTSSDSPASSVP